MDGLMMDYQLTLAGLLDRAELMSPRKEIISRLPDRSFHRYTYADMARRARSLARALGERGYERGTRVATLCWNHYQHIEAYFGVPLSGNVVHTLNLRLHPDDLAYIVSDADDRVLIVDESLLGIYEAFRDRVELDSVIVIGDAPDYAISYEQVIEQGAATDANGPWLAESDAALLCYTSGTTGRPKGVLYSHRALVIHALACVLPGSIGPAEDDVVMPVVPMFHANAWGYPHAAAITGATQVLPGPHLDPESLLDAIEEHRVTLTAGVPTVWIGVLALLDAEPGRHELGHIRKVIVGGSAAPGSLLRGFEERHGIRAVHAWGMTEMTPLGTVCELTSEVADEPYDARWRRRIKQGRPIPLVEVRARGDDGLIEWDGVSMGELEVRGPFVARAYFGAEADAERWTSDGWFRTGDIVSIDEYGYVEIRDRSKDLVKSGGEWISSLALENALMEHPAIREAAVIAVPDEKWGERPMACVVASGADGLTADDVTDFLGARVAKWWIPETVVLIDEIPKTGVGKYDKVELRRRFGSD